MDSTSSGTALRLSELILSEFLTMQKIVFDICSELFSFLVLEGSSLQVKH